MDCYMMEIGVSLSLVHGFATFYQLLCNVLALNWENSNELFWVADTQHIRGWYHITYYLNFSFISSAILDLFAR